ncbi:lipocalin family protein [Nonomuraea thailandensis]
MADKTPNPAMRQLDVLVGTWKVTNYDDGKETDQGTVRFEWLEGGFYLIQHVDLGVSRSVEYIGYDPETGTLKSHLFGQSHEILKYTWEVTGDTLTIWYGDPGSPPVSSARSTRTAAPTQGPGNGRVAAFSRPWSRPSPVPPFAAGARCRATVRHRAL